MPFRFLARVAAAVAVGTLAVPAPGAVADDLIGKPVIVDGQTLELLGQRVRLSGIRSPALDQTCAAAGETWNCGEEAAFALAFAAAPHWITCEKRGQDPDGTWVALCHAGPVDFAAHMVERGLAVAARAESRDYVDEERTARQAGLGVWRGGAEPPLADPPADTGKPPPATSGPPRPLAPPPGTGASSAQP